MPDIFAIKTKIAYSADGYVVQGLDASIEDLSGGAELAADIAALQGHLIDTDNPHSTTASQVGLGSVDNLKQVPFSISTDSSWASGWANRTPTLSITASSGTFTLTITGSIVVWVKGVRYTKTNDSITVNGLSANAKYYIYYNNSGVLTAEPSTATSWSILDGLGLTAIVYYNHTRAMAIVYDERHKAGRDLQWHNWAHDTVGPRLEGNTSFAITTTPPTTTTINVDSGIYYDEDIELSFSAQTTVRMWYRSGLSAMLFDATPASKALVVNGDATPKIAYDDGGTVTYHSAGAKKYYVYYLYAVNAVAVSSGSSAPIYCIMGQAQYSTLAAAQAATDPALPAEMPSNEMKLLHILIYSQGAGAVAYEGSVDKRFVSTVSTSTVSATVTAASVTFTPAGAIAATNVQAALEELDTEKSSTAHTHTITDRIVCIIDGGGSAITTGVKARIYVPFTCTLTAYTMLADQSGSIVIDVWKDTLANYPPTDADAMPGSGKEPTISSATNSQDTDISNWTSTAVTAGDCLSFNVDSCTSITWVSLVLTVTRAI